MLPGPDSSFVSYVLQINTKSMHGNAAQCIVSSRTATGCTTPCRDRRFTDTCRIITMKHLSQQDRLSIYDSNVEDSQESRLDVVIDQNESRTYWNLLLLAPDLN